MGAPGGSHTAAENPTGIIKLINISKDEDKNYLLELQVLTVTDLAVQHLSSLPPLPLLVDKDGGFNMKCLLCVYARHWML